MPFVKAYIHFVWSTKNRVQTLNTPDLRQMVWKHIRENAIKKDIFVDFVNGHAEHCHCLVSLGIDQTISKVMQLINGESAFWFNKQGLTKQKLEWQGEYFAVSVSESQLDTVRNYIMNQEEHHKHKTFEQEYNEFIVKYGFKKFPGCFWLKPKTKDSFIPPAKAGGNFMKLISTFLHNIVNYFYAMISFHEPLFGFGS